MASAAVVEEAKVIEIDVPPAGAAVIDDHAMKISLPSSLCRSAVTGPHFFGTAATRREDHLVVVGAHQFNTQRAAGTATNQESWRTDASP